MTSGFELFARAALCEVLEKGIGSRGPFFQTEIKTHCRNMKIAELPIHYRVDGHHVHRQATMRQERNEHDLMRDFRDEVPGYLNNSRLCQALWNLSLQSGTDKYQRQPAHLL